MHTSKIIRVFASLAACALMLSAIGSAKNPVQRPFKIAKGEGTLVVNLVDASFVGVGSGVATHRGLFANEAYGTMDLAAGVMDSAIGIATSANGDQLFWEIVPGQPDVFYITGGTGHFEGAVGTVPFAYTSEPVVTIDYDNLTMTISFTYDASGTITY